MFSRNNSILLIISSIKNINVGEKIETEKRAREKKMEEMEKEHVTEIRDFESPNMVVNVKIWNRGSTLGSYETPEKNTPNQ